MCLNLCHYPCLQHLFSPRSCFESHEAKYSSALDISTTHSGLLNMRLLLWPMVSLPSDVSSSLVRVRKRCIPTRLQCQTLDLEARRSCLFHTAQLYSAPRRRWAAEQQYVPTANHLPLRQRKFARLRQCCLDQNLMANQIVSCNYMTPAEMFVMETLLFLACRP